MFTAMLSVENIFGADHDIWNVNVEEEYHEEKTVDVRENGERGTGRSAPITPRRSTPEVVLPAEAEEPTAPPVRPQQVVYPTTADKYFAPKPGPMPPPQPGLKGARPWSHTCCTTNSLC